MSDQKIAFVTWKGTGLDFAGKLGSGYEFDLSGNADATAGSPMEFLLAGIAGCTAVDIVLILQKQRQPVIGVEVEIIGIRADTIPKVYTEMTLVYVVRGDLDPKAVERAIELSEEKYCSASIMFKQAGITINSSLRLLPE